jgi:hypothetical protein
LLVVARALLPTLGLDPPLLPSPGLGLPGSSPSYEFAYLALSGSSTLLLVGGLLGLHASSAGGHGRLGTTGFVLACAGVSLAGALEPAVVLGARARPLLDAAAVAGLVGLLGLVLLGVAALRARTLSLPWGALPLAIASVQALSVLSNVALARSLDPETFYRVSAAAPALVGVGWVLLGYALLRSSVTGAGPRGHGELVR